MSSRLTEPQRWTLATGSAPALIFLVCGQWRTGSGMLLGAAVIALVLLPRMRFNR